MNSLQVTFPRIINIVEKSDIFSLLSYLIDLGLYQRISFNSEVFSN